MWYFYSHWENLCIHLKVSPFITSTIEILLAFFLTAYFCYRKWKVCIALFYSLFFFQFIAVLLLHFEYNIGWRCLISAAPDASTFHSNWIGQICWWYAQWSQIMFDIYMFSIFLFWIFPPIFLCQKIESNLPPYQVSSLQRLIWDETFRTSLAISSSSLTYILYIRKVSYFSLRDFFGWTWSKDTCFTDKRLKWLFWLWELSLL